MNTNDLAELWGRDPIDTLACLFWRLRNDVPWRTQCGQASSVQDRQAKLLDALENGQTPDLRDDDGFALLAALDQHLADQRIGSAPLHAVVEDHDPPLWVAPRPKGWNPRVDGPDQVARWMRHHAVGPTQHAGIEVRVTRATAVLVREWPNRKAVMVAGFTDDVGPLNEAEEEDAFHTANLAGPDVRQSSLESLLPVLSTTALRALILPELTLPRPMREAWTGQLVDSGHAPLLTVAGSYHEIIDGERRNVAVLTDVHGTPLLQQWKMQPLHIDPVREVIAGGRAVELLVGPWGTLAVAICRDFCEYNNNLWAALTPDLVLVPSMGNPATMSAHERRAKDLSLAADTMVCMANQPVGFGDDPLLHGFIYGRGVNVRADSDGDLEHVRYRVEPLPGGLEED